MMHPHLHFNPFSEDFQADPFASYRELRASGTLHRTRLGVWIAVGYHECAAILGDPRFSRDHSAMSSRTKKYDRDNIAVQSAASAMLNLDGVSHERIRGVFGPLFNRRNIYRFQEDVEAAVKENLNKINFHMDFDLVNDFSFKISIDTIKSILGINDCENSLIRNFTTDSIIFLEPVTANQDQLEKAKSSYRNIAQYIKNKLEEKISESESIFRVKTNIYKGNISLGEAISNIAFVLSAGVDTTVNLICSGFEHMTNKALSESDLDDDRVINELLRLSPSIHMTGRIATEDVVFGSNLIKAGNPVIIVIAAANRDPNVFHNPDEISLQRSGATALSFGAGRHFCLGVHLAKLEARIAWRQLAQKLLTEKLEIVSTEYERRAFIRTPRQMIVRRSSQGNS